jgi:hypothetical protein
LVADDVRKYASAGAVFLRVLAIYLRPLACFTLVYPEK